jgi:hypothetical protein
MHNTTKNLACHLSLEYMLASGTTTSNTSINSQCSPYECSVPLTPVASVDETVPQKGKSDCLDRGNSAARGRLEIQIWM